MGTGRQKKALREKDNEEDDVEKGEATPCKCPSFLTRVFTADEAEGRHLLNGRLPRYHSLPAASLFPSLNPVLLSCSLSFSFSFSSLHTNQK